MPVIIHPICFVVGAGEERPPVETVDRVDLDPAPPRTAAEATPTRWKRSISSKSPPAVGKIRTGVPTVPQRTRFTSCPTRGEYQVRSASQEFLAAAGRRGSRAWARSRLRIHTGASRSDRGDRARSDARIGASPQKCSVKRSTSWGGKITDTFRRTASKARSVEKYSQVISSRWGRWVSQNSRKRSVSNDSWARAA